MRKYKVVCLPMSEHGKLEEMCNKYADDGWRIVSVIWMDQTTTIGQEHIMIILEKMGF